MEFEYTYSDNCIFKGNCTREDRFGCNEHCPIQPEFYYLMETSNIPQKYKGKKTLYPEDDDFKAFSTLDEIKCDIENFVSSGRSLYIWSKHTGNSKTTWACKMLKTYLAVVCFGNEFKDRAWFEYVPSFLMMAKNFENKDEREEHINAVLTRDLVVLDDVGSVNHSNYDISVLSNLINTRYSNGLATIYTSNLSPSELTKTSIDDRIIDRIASDIVIELKGTSSRRYSSKYKSGVSE